jgi:hypothetical protein
MHFLSFAWKDRGAFIDAGLRFISGFILDQFSSGNKAIEEEMCKTENRAGDWTSSRAQGVLNSILS